MRTRRLTSLRHFGTALVAVLTASTIAFILGTHLAPGWNTALITLATAAHLALVFTRARVPLAVVVIAGTGLLGTAVAAEPNGTDLWVYQSYGRLIVEYHDNPYVTPPVEHLDDPVVHRMHGYYIGDRAIYGPVLMGLATVSAATAGADHTAARLFWQGLAALSVAMAAWLLWRRVGQAGLVLFLLNPLVVYQVVHLAHIDAIIGLALLVGVLLAERERWVWATLAFTTAALVKAPLALVVVALLLYLVFARRHRTAAVCTAASAALALPLVIAVGPRAMLGALSASAGLLNKSAWAYPLRGGGHLFLLEVVNHDQRAAPRVLTAAIGVALAAVVAWVAWKLARRAAGVAPGADATGTANADGAAVVVAAVVALLVIGVYTSPWSFGWLLPLLPLASERVRGLALAHAAVFHLSTRWLLFAAFAVWGSWSSGRTLDALAAFLLIAQLALGFALLAVVVLRPGWIVEDGRGSDVRSADGRRRIFPGG